MRWTHQPATEDQRELYLAGANASFSAGWGDARLFDWAMLTPRAGRVAELIFAFDNDAPIAGSAVTFRNVRNGDERFLAAIMTGSWTRPEARGRGLFSSIIDVSLDVAREAGAEMLLAFVTATNASRRRLEDAGATMFDTAYCRGPVSSVAGNWPAASEPSGATFDYTGEEWTTQFIARPTDDGISILEHDQFSAVIERGPEFTRVHAFRGDESHYATLSAGHRLFCFTTRADLRETFAANGFEIVPGYIAALPLGSTSVPSWNLQNGDRL